MSAIWSEWFWSEKSARDAAKRVEAKGCYRAKVSYAMDASGRHDWRLEVFEK